MNKEVKDRMHSEEGETGSQNPQASGWSVWVGMLIIVEGDK